MDDSAIHGTGSPAATDGLPTKPAVSEESDADRIGTVPDAGIGRGSAADAPPEGAGEARPLPEEILKSVVHLQCESSAGGGVCDVYLVWTAHVSKESCREVEAVINSLKPQVVFLELCPSRLAILTIQNLHVPSFSEMIDMWRKKKMSSFGILYSWFLAKVADKLEVLPGSEFRVAFEVAREYGALVILRDHPVQYMSSVLLKVAREHNSVVAIVGKGHLPGIKSHWQEPVDMESLLEMPKRRSGVSRLLLQRA